MNGNPSIQFGNNLNQLNNQWLLNGNQMHMNGNFVNNFMLNEPITNIYFRIDNTSTLFIQAYPQDKIGTLFSMALHKHNHYKSNTDILHYRYFLNAKDITQYFLSDKPISSLGLKHYCEIIVNTKYEFQ